MEPKFKYGDRPFLLFLSMNGWNVAQCTVKSASVIYDQTGVRVHYAIDIYPIWTDEDVLFTTFEEANEIASQRNNKNNG